MEKDILDGLKLLTYEELNEENLSKAISEGPKSIVYTQAVEWLSKELKVFCYLDEHVNRIAGPEDSSSFLLELSSFLKELGCHYDCLTEGNVNERLHSKSNRLLLLNFLIQELLAARMVHVIKPDDSQKIVEVRLSESQPAADLKSVMIALNITKPPDNTPVDLIFKKVENKLKTFLEPLPVELWGKPLLCTTLPDKHWDALEGAFSELKKEYINRRELLLNRLDVTILSFRWSDRLKHKEDTVGLVYTPKRINLSTEPNVEIADLLAAREDLAYIEKTSSASVREKTKSSTNKVIIGRVPDRGGRPNEQEPPPPEMPSWQQRNAGGGGAGGGGGGRGGFQGGGGDRGGRVQGGWNQGGGHQDRGGYGGGRGGGNHDTRGYQDSRGGGHQDNRGGFQDNRGGYQDSRGGGHQDNRGGFQDNRGGYQDSRGGGHQDNRGGFQDNRGGYQDNRGGYQDNRGTYQNDRGGYQGNRGGYQNSRGGYQDNRGGCQDRGGYQNSRGGYQDNRGGCQDRGGYQDSRGGFQGRGRDRRGQNYR